MSDALAAALALWDERCAQAPEGQPTRRVPNLDVTLALEAELHAVADAEGVSTLALRRGISRARFDGHTPAEAVALAVQQAKGNT